MRTVVVLAISIANASACGSALDTREPAAATGLFPHAPTGFAVLLDERFADAKLQSPLQSSAGFSYSAGYAGHTTVVSDDSGAFDKDAHALRWTLPPDTDGNTDAGWAEVTLHPDGLGGYRELYVSFAFRVNAG